MSWNKETAAAGLPIWRGKDAIYNLNYETRLAWGVGGTLAASVAVIAILIGDGNSWGEGRGLAYLVGAGLAFPAVGCFLQIPKYKKFIGAGWTLTASAGRLTFDGAESWAVPLDRIARIETGKTADYQPSREYGTKTGAGLAGSLFPVPPHEWQVFLFMADGTRRVIYHANAARDDCAALAASIREYVEGAKLSAPAPSFPSSDAPRAAGFDL